VQGDVLRIDDITEKVRLEEMMMQTEKMMSEEICKRVFEPFYTTKNVGTGLGLSVSYFIITNHHKGTISVESESGKGAKFTIRLFL